MNGNGIDQATQARASSFPNEGPINTIHINANCPDALITTLKWTMKQKSSIMPIEADDG